MSATDTPAAAVRDEDSEPVTISEDVDGPDFILFSESAPLRPFSLPPSTLDAERSSFLSLTPDPALEVPQPPFVLADSSFLSFTDTPPAPSTPDPLSETLSVVQEEEEEEEEEQEEEDIGGWTKEVEEAKYLEVGDRDEEIDLGDAILLESGRSENVVVDKDPGLESDSEYVAPTTGEQTSFYYDKGLKRWVGKKPGL